MSVAEIISTLTRREKKKAAGDEDSFSSLVWRIATGEETNVEKIEAVLKSSGHCRDQLERGIVLAKKGIALQVIVATEPEALKRREAAVAANQEAERIVNEAERELYRARDKFNEAGGEVTDAFHALSTIGKARGELRQLFAGDEFSELSAKKSSLQTELEEARSVVETWAGQPISLVRKTMQSRFDETAEKQRSARRKSDRAKYDDSWIESSVDREVTRVTESREKLKSLPKQIAALDKEIAAIDTRAFDVKSAASPEALSNLTMFADEPLSSKTPSFKMEETVS